MSIVRPVGGASEFLRARPVPSSAPTYTGPGDIVSGATAWYGLRAYNAAYATGSNNAINVRRASDNTTSNIVILSNGNLDIASANTFAGVDATATASTTGSSTTVALTSASSTPHVGSTITGGGIVQPCYIVSVGSFVAGAGAVVVNQVQNISVAISISMQYGLFVTEAYDQTGNVNHVLQATIGKQPQLLPSGINSKPAILFSGGQALLTSGSVSSLTQPWSISALAQRPTSTGTIGGILETSNGQLLCPNIANIIWLYAGSSASGPAASDGVAHAFQALASGSSSVINVDGTSGSASGAGSSAFGGSVLAIGSNSPGSGQFLNAYVGEVGPWPLGFTTPNMSALHTNMSAFWGTP